MAQPTDNASRFEVSEPSSALSVPALSRYARPKPQAADAAAEPVREPDDEAPDPASAQARPQPSRERTGDARRIDPIVEAASDEWATDPSPPQPVHDARYPQPAQAAGAVADPHSPQPAQQPSAAPTHAPALREHPARTREEARRPPFWKRLAMARPHAEAQAPPKVEIPKDLLKPAIERIDHLTRRFEREQKALQGRLDEFEHNLTRLWELEEQMGLEEVRAQLAVMQANQEEIADGLHHLAKRLTFAAGAVVAVFGALLIWLIL